MLDQREASTQGTLAKAMDMAHLAWWHLARRHLRALVFGGVKRCSCNPLRRGVWIYLERFGIQFGLCQEITSSPGFHLVNAVGCRVTEAKPRVKWSSIFV